MLKELNDRVALITGGASGIGRAIAEQLAEDGMRLALVDIEPHALEQTAYGLTSRGFEVLPLIADVSDYDGLNAAALQTRERFGGIDVLCNNAGVGLEGPVESWSTEGWAWVLGVNVMGVVNGVRAVAPILKANAEGGHILNVASIGGITAAANHGQYGASKFAVVGLSQSLRDELAPHGVGVSVVCPGFVKSRIATSARNAPPQLLARQQWLMREGFEGPAADLFRTIETRVESGLDPRVVARLSRDAILNNDFYVLTETEFLGEVERRMKALSKAVDKVSMSARAAEPAEAARG